jgi:phage gpG-like protein
MSLELKFVEQSDTQVVARIREITPRLNAALEKKMMEVVIMLRDRIVALKLSGQVLKTRTGTLRRSIVTDVKVTEDAIIGTVAVSNKAWYGKLHEYGGIFSVPAHLRRGTVVRAYTVRFPERSFMRSTLREQQVSIRDQFQAVLRKVLADE